MDGEYQTIDGRDVRILCINRRFITPVVALVKDDEKGVESLWNLTDEGMIPHNGIVTKFLVPKNPYTKFMIDDPVLVGDYQEGPRLKRYFAGIDGNGQATCFPDGKTSWTHNPSELPTKWKYCEKAYA